MEPFKVEPSTSGKGITLGRPVLHDTSSVSSQGMGLEDVKNQFGHNSITLTSNTYGHVLEQRQREVAREVARVMDAVLGG